MKKRLISMFLLLCLLLTALLGCGKDDGTITAEEAQEIVLDYLGMSANQVQLHPHAGEHNGQPCYSIYVTYDGTTWEYKVDMQTGEILSITKSSHSH